MNISLRSMLTAGVTAVTASAIVAAPAIAPLPAPQVAVSRPVQLSTAVQTLSRQEVSSALAAIEKFAADSGAPAATADAASPVPLNTASNVVDAVYQGIVYWTNYGVELANYALGWVPFGGLIASQINVVYPPIISFTDTVVYSFIDPVLNDPLNPTVWANGLGAIAYSAVASVIQVGINEVNYLLSWLPPLPPLPFAAPAALATTMTATDAGGLPPVRAAIKALHDTLRADVDGTVKTVHKFSADIAAVLKPPAAVEAAPDAAASLSPTEVADAPVADTTDAPVAVAKGVTRTERKVGGVSTATAATGGAPSAGTPSAGAEKTAKVARIGKKAPGHTQKKTSKATGSSRSSK